MTGIAIEDIEIALDRLNSQRRVAVFFASSFPDGFPERPDYILAAINGRRPPSATDLRYIRACGERLRARLARAIYSHTPTP